VNSVPELKRRAFLRQFAGLLAATQVLKANALMPDGLPLKNTVVQTMRLTDEQARAFRHWIQLIVQQQLNRGPTPRWQQRDCAGLVRFASAEALRTHDRGWLKANGFLGKKLPPELNLSPAQLAEFRHAWLRADGTQGAFVSAMELVQNNTVPVGRDMAQAQVADVLLFDQGQAQHLMIWMGQYMAYHTGTVTAGDNGLRAYPLGQLMSWQDTRWQPHAGNPNFVGIFRLFFLSRT
jgi:hypothetical protein